MQDGAAQAPMGVDKAGRAHCDQEMMLRRSGACEDEVAAADRLRGGREAGARDEAQVAGDIGISQPVAGGRLRTPERASDEADAIDPACRVAPAQSKGRADKRFGSGGELARPARGPHRGIGYWASRPVPGRNGSP